MISNSEKVFLSYEYAFKLNMKLLKKSNISKYRRLYTIFQLEFLQDEKKKSYYTQTFETILPKQKRKIRPEPILNDNMVDIIRNLFQFAIETVGNAKDIANLMEYQIEFHNIIQKSRNEQQILFKVPKYKKKIKFRRYKK